MWRTLILIAICTNAASLPTNREKGSVADRLEALEHGLAPVKDLIPLVECDGDRACSAKVLDSITTLKSKLFTFPGISSVVSLIRGKTNFAASVSCTEGCSAATFQDAIEGLQTEGVPLIAVVPGGSPPRRTSGAPWITLTPRAAEALGSVEELLQSSLSALEGRGNLSLALNIDVDSAWFSSKRTSLLNVVHLVGEGRIILNPLLANKFRIDSVQDARNNLLNSTYNALATRLAAATANSSSTSTASASTALASTTVPFLTAQEEALAGVVKEVMSALVGERGFQLPWKCFVCVVSLSMLVPLAVNIALQALVSAYCTIVKVPDEDCIFIRYDMIALGVLMTPLEVYPIAEVCVVQHGCT